MAVSRQHLALELAEPARPDPAAQGDVLCIELPGRFEVSPASMAALWDAALVIARTRGVERVLLEAPSPLRGLRLIDAYRHGRLLSTLTAPGLRVACCFPGFEPDAVSWLFSTTANAGAGDVRLFRNLDDALGWLNPA